LFLISFFANYMICYAIPPFTTVIYCIFYISSFICFLLVIRLNFK